ncbi:MAG: DUF4139 domain-containing protein [candidate division KSB1 bacterium]|nr:DUF4139 domain-containing protein [candidate division KSB1 bacterium]
MKTWLSLLSRRRLRPNRLFSEWQATVILIFLCAAGAAAQETASLVVYSRLALVRETRDLRIGADGTATLRELPMGIQAESLYLDDPDGKRPAILNSRLKRPQAGLAQILKQNTGAEIVLYSKILNRIQGTLVAATGGKLYLRVGDRTLRVLSADDVVAYDVRYGDYRYRSRPEIVLRFRDLASTTKRFRLHYLTDGLSWHAHYIALLRRDQERLTLSGQFVINNRTDRTFEKARLTLVAGDVNLSRAPVEPVYRAMEKALAAPAPQVERIKEFEYYVYRVPFSVSLDRSEQQQIPFLPPKRIPFKKHYIYEPRISKTDVLVRLELTNDSKLFGEPLPAGNVQLYQEQADGRLFIGEDRIRHTPVGERVWLQLGRVFDIKAEREKVAQSRVGPKSRSEVYAIRMRNHKDRAVTVRVVERFSGNWSISQSSLPVAKKTADRVEWQVDVPAGQSTELRYTVLFQW